MPALVVLLRGVNLAGRNRVAMPRLREALAEAGFEDVRTYVQSGNVVLSSRARPSTVAAKVERAIHDEFGLDIPVVVRTRDEVAEVVGRNPLGEVATNPKRYQVTFLAEPVGRDVVERIQAEAAPGEKVAVEGREIYAWHPDGVGRSKLATLLSGKKLGVTATARNWTTVTKLLELADEPG